MKDREKEKEPENGSGIVINGEELRFKATFKFKDRESFEKYKKECEKNGYDW